MATLLEMRQLYGAGDLKNKIEASICIAVNAIKNEAPATENHAARVAWAKAAILDTRSEAERMLKIILAENAEFTSAQISSATDQAINEAVQDAVNFFAV